MPTLVLALALAFALGRAYFVARWSISPELWLSVVRQTLEKGERARAIKIASAVASPLGDAMRAAIMRATAFDAQARPEDVEPALREAYTRALAPLELLVVTRALSLVVVVLVAVGGAQASSRGGFEPLLVSLGLVALVAVVAAEIRATQVLRLGPAALEAALPHLLPAPSPAPPAPARIVPTPLPPAVVVPREGAHVRVRRDGALVRDVPLDGAIVKIGSISTAQICLAADSVSRMHAVLEKQDDEAWTLIDLGSGTHVNGAPVDKTTVHSGDRIQIGPFELTLEKDPPR